MACTMVNLGTGCPLFQVVQELRALSFDFAVLRAENMEGYIDAQAAERAVREEYYQLLIDGMKDA